MNKVAANIRRFFSENWMSKLATLLVAISVWYMIKRHLDASSPYFPVPGTDTYLPPRASRPPMLDSHFMGPAPPPIPGVDGNPSDNF